MKKNAQKVCQFQKKHYLCTAFREMLLPKGRIQVEYRRKFAEIAQLVEHNLAKVGVASSSLVFRSNSLKDGAAMVELVDTRDLKSLGQ